MGTFKDLMPAQNGWIHELARAEIHPEAEKLLQLGRSWDPQQLVEESTIEFLTELREQFTEFARVFNGYAESGTRFQEVKVYSVAQTAADFMVFRNQIKLLVANTAHGVIQISFAQHVRGALAVDGQIHGYGPVQGQVGSQPGAPAVTQSQDLLAQVGPFRDIFWTFQGEKVKAEQVAKYYFAEFARLTRDTRRSKAGNQILLDQIKALLQEKGLDL
ncbi:MAG: hypothetical protein NDJ90_00465 [Oligoflexia bacterium]|nr:hypothetical protein [Oligoflexia bacterium]